MRDDTPSSVIERQLYLPYRVGFCHQLIVGQQSHNAKLKKADRPQRWVSKGAHTKVVDEDHEVPVPAGS